jgi:hypothetical protein
MQGGMIPRFHRPVCDLYGAIGVKAGVNSILFDLTATISSSRPNFPWPLRAAAVKGGRRPSRNDLPLMVASTAADLLDWGGRFQLFERVSSRDLVLPITTIPRGARHQARASRRKLVFGRSVRIATMMQSCASAAALRFLWIVERYFCELGLADARPRIRIELKLGDGARRHVGNLA